jgi:CRP/FNR family transcriptional regulator, cyclic AMP receptor protein
MPARRKAGEELARVADLAECRRYQAGDMVVWQGEPSDAVYLIQSGIAAVTRVAASDRETSTLADLMPGQSFGEVGILEDSPCSASVAALTEQSVLAVRRREFLEIVRCYPVVAIEVARTPGRYLVEADRRQLQAASSSRLVLLLGSRRA